MDAPRPALRDVTSVDPLGWYAPRRPRPAGRPTCRTWSEGVTDCLMRVYISAPSRVDLSTLKMVLAELNVQYVPTEDAHVAARSSDEDWPSVDAVLAVLSNLGDAHHEQVYFEAGLALGRGIPVLLLADQDYHPRVPALAATLFVRANLANPEALRFHLGLWLRKVAQPNTGEGRSQPRLQGQQVDVPRLRDSLSRLRGQVSGTARGRALELWVGDLFRSGGGDLVAPSDPADRGFDFVADLPGLSPRTGPLVVQVKSTTSPRALVAAALHLQSQVLQQRAGLGLLLFDDDDLPLHFALQVVPMVISFGADELLRELEHASLADVLARSRDEAVHRL